MYKEYKKWAISVKFMLGIVHCSPLVVCLRSHKKNVRSDEIGTDKKEEI